VRKEKQGCFSYGVGASRMRKWIRQAAILVLGGGLVLLGLVAMSQSFRAHLRGLDRYTLAFEDIDCTPPPNLERSAFLSEVQYLANMPSRLRLLDDDLGPRLMAAFARHPWVERVERVELRSQGVQVWLVYRTPVLAVQLEGETRVVDRHGILLPASASTEGLPVFHGHARAPAGPAGTPWGDSAVEQAARMAGH
jgi:hypothetical protein